MRSQIRLKLILIGLNIAGVVLSFVLIFTIFLIPGPSNVLGTGATKSLVTSSPSPIKAVWLIMMENTNWTGYSQLKGNLAAPYINKTLIPEASHAEQYYTGIHPSLPNYLWLEAGDNLGVVDNNPPSSHHFATTNHFVTSMKNAGLTWKGYLEDISGTVCPLSGVGEYVTRHNAMVYFDDVTNGLNKDSAFCIAHERPYTELAGDLQNNRIQNFNYIIPDLCHNMHGDGTNCGSTNLVTQADNWLKTLITQIRATRAYQNGGAIIINWDEGHDNADGSESTQPLPLIVLSPFAKGGGYSNTIQYSHSSLLRTLQEIFGASPLLCYAAPSNDLSDLFHPGVIPSSTPASITTAITTLGQDTFQRPNQTCWGKASDGLSWTGDPNTPTNFTITDGRGEITGTASKGYSAILGPKATDAEVLFSGSISAFSSSNFASALRWTDSNNYYKAYIDGFNLVLMKMVHGTFTRLASTQFAAKANTSYTLRFKVTGRTLSARVWQTSSSEPSKWMVSATDSSFTSGNCGLVIYLQNGVTAKITSFRATSA